MLKTIKTTYGYIPFEIFVYITGRFPDTSSATFSLCCVSMLFI